jgi:hypothetical protein
MSSKGGGTSKNVSIPSSPLITSPLGVAFNNLFGVPVSFKHKNKFNPQGDAFAISGDVGSEGKTNIAPQIFEPEDFLALKDQLDPVPESIFEQLGRSNLLGSQALFEDLVPTVRDISSTGLRTDIAPIVEREQNRFSQEIIPELANQFGFLGGGGSVLSSDFGAAAAREASNLGFNLGGIQAELDEAAAGRRLQGVQLQEELATTAASFPVALGRDILSLSEANFDQTLLQRPGGQLLNFFNNLICSSGEHLPR